MNFRLLLLLCIGLAGCGPRSDEVKPNIIGNEPAKPQVLKFLAIGDAGSGSAQQIAVGQAMADVCSARGCDLAVELGDNIYDHGPDSASDPQFETAFEIPYAPLTKLRVPIWVALGNHDNSSVNVADQQAQHFPGDGGNNARGNYEVEYAKSKQTMWKMPARYY